MASTLSLQTELAQFAFDETKHGADRKAGNHGRGDKALAWRSFSP